MSELIASQIVNGEELHFIIFEDTFAEDDGDPFEVIVHADHYLASRRTIESVTLATLAEAQAYCRDRYGVATSAWRPHDEIRFRYEFAFDYNVSSTGVPQPHPLGFEGARIVFRLSQVEHFDEPSTPVLDISGNPEGLRRLAAELLLCADSERYDPEFHIHLDRGTDFFSGDIDATLRAPAYFERLQQGPLLQFSWSINLDEVTDDSPTPGIDSEHLPASDTPGREEMPPSIEDTHL
jgi:hypothetical protein